MLTDLTRPGRILPFQALQRCSLPAAVRLPGPIDQEVDTGLLIIGEADVTAIEPALEHGLSVWIGVGAGVNAQLNGLLVLGVNVSLVHPASG